MMRMYSALTVLAMLCACALTAQGSTFQFGTGNLVVDYQAAPGSSVAIDVYLYETFASGAESAVLDDEGGLLSASVAIDRIGGGAADPAGLLVAGNVAHNVAFNDTGLLDVSVHLTGGVFDRATLTEARDIIESSGVSVEAPATGVRRILLGNFTFTAGGLQNEVTAFRIQDSAAAPQGDTVTWDLPGLALDSYIQPFDFTITTTPEPATAALLGAFGCLITTRRRRRAGNHGTGPGSSRA